MRTLFKPAVSQGFIADALRDLIIVIVGILAALWMEAWWQGLQDRAIERDLLTNLRAEFVRNDDELRSTIENWQQVIDENTRVHALMGPTVDAEDIAELARIDADPVIFRFYDPRHGQLTSLINSGQLGLIENPELRARIADWPALVADMDSSRELYLQQAMDIFPLVAESDAFWPDSAFDANVEKILTSQYFDNWLAGVNFNLMRMVSEGEVIAAANEEIIALIDERLAD